MRGSAALVAPAAVVALAAPAALLAPPPASAAPGVSGLASNYWWEAEQGPSTLPAPPSVPPGGLWVSSDPTGAQAVSAVRFVLPAAGVAPVLSLTVSSAQPATGIGGDVVACPTTSAWSPGPGPGQWSTRPAPDCQAGQVPGALSPDGHVLSFSLASLATGGVVDVVIQAAPPGPVGSPTFDVTFEPVTSADVSGVAPAAATAPAPGPAPGGSVPPTSAPGGSTSSGAAAGPASDTAAVPAGISPPSSGPLTAGVKPVELAAPPRTGGSAGSPPSLAAGGTSSGSGTGSAYAPAGVNTSAVGPVLLTARSWRDRILLGLALVDIAGYLMWSGRLRPTRVPVRVGKPPPLR